jgi:hypothetical protein
MKYAGVVALVLVAAIGTFVTVEKVSPVGWGWWGGTNTTEGVALKGYDPVAYFFGGGALPGDETHAFQWQDATWHFINAENKAQFTDDPEKYAPQFGSFCSFAVGKGFTADVDPEAWHIEDGKLYLFADKNVRDEWVAGIDSGSLQQSQDYWASRQ